MPCACSSRKKPRSRRWQPGSANDSQAICALQRARQLADYDSAVAFSAEDARQDIEDARSFSRAILALICREGWLDAGQWG